MKQFNEKIRKLREAKGITQEEMSNELNVSRVAYGQIETGKTKSISLEMAIGISKALDVPFNVLFDIPEDDSFSSLGKQIETIKNKVDFYIDLTEKLKEDLRERQEFIKLLQSERNNLREFFVMQFVSHYSNYIGFIEDLIDQAPTEEFKSMLQRKKENTIRFEKTIQQKFIDMGLFTMGDVAKYINEMKIMGLHLKDINEM